MEYVGRSIRVLADDPMASFFLDLFWTFRQILYYLSALRLFVQMKSRLGKTMAELASILHEIPAVIIEGMIERFTESPKGSTR